MGDDASGGDDGGYRGGGAHGGYDDIDIASEEYGEDLHLHRHRDDHGLNNGVVNNDPNILKV